jgi:hypothetical protein
MYPQEGAIGFPLAEYTALKEPLGRTAVTGFARNVMVD